MDKDHNKMTGIVMVEAKKLRPHPKNPRKNLGDLSELTESIRQNGIMQNLTAVPDPDKDDGYMIIIGHRRFAAGKKAGLKQFPVSIVALDEPDQVKLMLCENIQRNDLTVIEQAAGFQMMMDFGITVEELSQETGFAPSTIYHRLNIAKLDQKALKSKLDQLTLTDLIELEKIEDIDKRNELLTSDSYQPFRQRVEQAYQNQEREKVIEKFREMCEAAGLKEKQANTWDNSVGEHIDKYVTKDTNLDEFKLEKNGIKMTHYSIRSPHCMVYAKAAKAKKKEKTKQELQMESIEERMKEICRMMDDAANECIVQMKTFSDIDDARWIRKECGNDAADEFIKEVFIYFAVTKPYMSDVSTFSQESLGTDSLWNYGRGPHQYDDFAADTRAAVLKKGLKDPLEYAEIFLIDSVETTMKRGLTEASNYWNWSEGMILRGEAAYKLRMGIASFRMIGFTPDEDIVQILDCKHELFGEIETLAEKYKELREGGAS